MFFIVSHSTVRRVSILAHKKHSTNCAYEILCLGQPLQTPCADSERHSRGRSGGPDDLHVPGHSVRPSQQAPGHYL